MGEQLRSHPHEGPPGIPVGRSLELFHTPQGSGLTLPHTVRNGPVTLVGFVCLDDGGLKLLVAEGEAIPGDWLRLGIGSSRLRFALPADELHERWNAAGPAYDVVLVAGHFADRVCAAARTLGITTVRLG